MTQPNLTPQAREAAFRAAANKKLPFGKYIGQTLDQVAETEEGLRYLDWARGEWTNKPDLVRALNTYLSDPAIEKELFNARHEEALDREYKRYITR